MPAIVMIRCGLAWLLLGATATFVPAQTTYYVAAGGNDNNDGRSTDRPLQSLAKVSALPLQPGDQVLFRRTDTFRGTLFVRQSGSAGQPIVIDAYGSGNKPLLAGSVPVGNWTNTGNNTWQANCPTCGSQVTGLYRNGTSLPLGRYPNLSDANKGYLTVQSHSGKTQLTSQQSLSTNWTGGEVVYRPVQWILNRAAITGQSGNTLTVAGSGNYDISDNWGYFIQNHPATLDQTGEWCYNPADKTIRLYDNQGNPNDQAIEATAFAEAVNLTNASFVSVRNVQISRAIATGLLITNGSNLVIAGNDITQSGEDGITVRGNDQQLLIENNLIEDINNNGVTISAYQHVTFRGNTIRRVGLTPGRGKSGDGTYVGFQSASTANTLIENNVLDNIGYNALNFSNSTTVQRNQISNFCLTKSDGSGLYIWNGNQQSMGNIRLLSNIVYNGIGAPEGTPGGSAGANGIYLDDCTTNIEVADNTVYNCRGLGLFLHGSSNIRLTGNTAYNNNEGQLAIMSANGCQPRSNVIQNNIFVSRLASQFNVKYESNQDDLSSYGQFDNNVYARPFDDTFKILAVYNRTTGAALSLSDWQNRYGKDLTSASSPITYASGNPDDYIRCIANPTANAVQVPLDGTYRDARNNAYSGQVSIAAFASVVLLKQINSTSPPPPTITLRDPDNPANAVAGLDYAYYEGSWNNLPNFDALTPAKTGTATIPTVSVRSREDNFGLRYQGYVSVPTDGVYTFYTASDDGSKLFIGSTEVVNNDGGHPDQERSGSIGLRAGLHALTIPYFEGGGDQTLTVSYAGPNIGKQVIPEGSYRRVSAGGGQPAGTGTGLRVEYFNNPDLRAPVVVSRTEATIDADWGDGSPVAGVGSNDFSIRWTGQVEVPVSGQYVFNTVSDDGVRLWVNGVLVIDNWTAHPPTSNKGAGLMLVGGQKYTIQMEYFEWGGGAVARLLWAYPGQNQQVVPQGRLYPATGSGRTGAGETDDVRIVYPVPTYDEFTLVVNDDVQTIRVVDQLGRSQLQFSDIRRGQPLAFGSRLPVGGYLLHIVYANGTRRTEKLLKLGR